MIRVAICDDEPHQLEKNKAACDAYFTNHTDIDVAIFPFGNPNDFLDKIEKSGGFDIAVLDICMPGISGIDVAREIRKRNDKTEIIFFTSSDEFHGEAYGVKAMRYLHKPLVEAEFYEALDNALRLVNAPSGKKIQIFGESGAIHGIEANKILYVESFRTYRMVHTLSGSYKDTKRSFGVLLEDLCKLYPDRFVSPVRGYIVNFENVTSVTMEGITMKGGEVVPVKSGNFRKLREMYLDYLFQKGV